MAQVKISQELIDKLATMEVSALLEGLSDPDLCANPAFLAKVRQWLKDNEIMTSAELEGSKQIKKSVKDIPNILEEIKAEIA